MANHEISRRSFLRGLGAATILMATGQSEKAVNALTPKKAEAAEIARRGIVRLNANEALTISAQKIKVGGVEIDVNPEENPNKRATVEVAVKNNMSIEVEVGEGAYLGKFRLNSQDFYGSMDNVLEVQGSRNDIAGNCTQQGCTGGSREVSLVGHTSGGRDLFELGTDRERAFRGTQLQLREDITFLGEANLEEVPQAAQPRSTSGSKIKEVHLERFDTYNFQNKGVCVGDVEAVKDGKVFGPDDDPDSAQVTTNFQPGQEVRAPFGGDCVDNVPQEKINQATTQLVDSKKSAGYTTVYTLDAQTGERNFR